MDTLVNRRLKYADLLNLYEFDSNRMARAKFEHISGILYSLKENKFISNSIFEKNKNKKFNSISHLYKELDILHDDLQFLLSIYNFEPLQFDNNGLLINFDKARFIFELLYSLYLNESLILKVKKEMKLWKKEENENIIKTYFRRKKLQKATINKYKACELFSIIYYSVVFSGYSFSIKDFKHSCTKSIEPELNTIIKSLSDGQDIVEALDSVDLFEDNIISFARRSIGYDIKDGFEKITFSLERETHDLIVECF